MATTQTSIGFIKKRSNLVGLIKKLVKITPEAIEMLEETMKTSEDEKLAVGCAKKLLDLYVQIVDDEHRHDMEAKAMQLKIFGASSLANDLTLGAEKEDEEEDNDIPLIDFANVIDIED